MAILCGISPRCKRNQLAVYFLGRAAADGRLTLANNYPAHKTEHHDAEQEEENRDGDCNHSERFAGLRFGSSGRVHSAGVHLANPN